MLRKPLKKLVKRLSVNNYQTLNHIELNGQNLLDNVALIHSQHPNFGIIPVLKANAYGHGLSEIAQILNYSDCSFIAVDGYFEAARIRDLTNHPILVMGYILPENTKLLDVKRCSFVVQDEAGLRAFGELAQTVRIHMEVNTGMNRLGLQAKEITRYLKVLKQYPNLELEGIMTHLADADNETEDSYTISQVKLFDSMVEKVMSKGFKPRIIHIAQTAGSVKAKSRYANAIRLGIGLYGINPLGKKDKNYKELDGLKPVLELKSTIIKTLDLDKGDRISYNGIFTATKPMRIGVLPLGYYEGIPRELSNKGHVTYKNKTMPIVGRVCMNHIMIDISGTSLKTNDEVIVISANNHSLNSVAQISSLHQIFSYSLLTGISSSVRRLII